MNLLSFNNSTLEELKGAYIFKTYSILSTLSPESIKESGDSKTFDEFLRLLGRATRRFHVSYEDDDKFYQLKLMHKRFGRFYINMSTKLSEAGEKYLNDLYDIWLSIERYYGLYSPLNVEIAEDQK